MIKTEHHGMIEPRVGDVVTDSIDEDHDEPHTFEVTSIRSDGVLMSGDNCGFAPDFCTLLHRPFMVGDEVEHHNPIYFTWERITAIHGGATKADLELIADSDTARFRHANPAWRDHSEWEKQDD